MNSQEKGRGAKWVCSPVGQRSMGCLLRLYSSKKDEEVKDAGVYSGKAA